MSSLVHYILFSFFCHICSEKFSFFSKKFPFNCPLFIGKHSLFFGVMGTQSLPLWSKTSLFVLSAVQTSSLDSRLFQKKTFSFSFLQFVEKKNAWFSLKKTISLPGLLLFLLIVVCSVVAVVTWTSATGHPLQQAVSFHFLLLLFLVFNVFYFYACVFLRFLFLFFILCSVLYNLFFPPFVLFHLSFFQLFSSLLSYNSSYSSSSCSSSSCSSSSSLISSCFSVFLWTLPFSTSFSFKFLWTPL